MNTTVESARDGRSRRRIAATSPSSPAERAARGKAARAEVPRSSHAEWAPAARQDPVAVLEAQAATRVPELVPIRYGRMLVSPFTFFRGSAAVMAGDLGDSPRSGISVQLCGDAHLSNFGGFASPERALVFDINDFDETHPGPWEWDVKRLAASVEIAGRDLGFKDAARRAAVLQRDFYVRQLWDWKLSGDLETMRPSVAAAYGELCGRTLARAHARSGDRIAIASYLGSGDAFDRALAEFAAAYADQNERDFRALAGAVESGAIAARTDI